KLLHDGVVLRSQACLIGNARLLSQNKQALRMASMMLELIDARMQARNRSMLTAYIQSESVERMQRICNQLRPFVAGVEFRKEYPTINRGSTVSTHAAAAWYTISGVVTVGGSASELLETVAVLRNA